MRKCPPTVGTLVQPVVLQQPAPQFTPPGVQLAAQPVLGFLLHAPVVALQMQPCCAADPPANAHPQFELPATPQHPDAFVAPEQLLLQELEQLGALPSGHVGPLEHVLVAPPTLQLPPPWQQQQQPETAPAPELVPQLSVEKSAHARFVGVAAAAGAGTATE